MYESEGFITIVDSSAEIGKTSAVELKIDNHIHSKYSSCCEENYSLQDIFLKQAENRMQYACVSDHIHISGDTAGLAQHRAWFDAQTRSWKNGPAIQVFIGAELTVTGPDGELPLIQVDSACKPEFTIVGCHHIPGRRNLSMGSIAAARADLVAWSDRDMLDLYGFHGKMLTKTLERNFFTILAHPYDFFFRCGIFDARLLEGFQALCVLCREAGIAVEINNASARRCFETTGGQQPFNRNCISPDRFFLDMLKIAAGENVMLSPGSDAHSMDSIGRLDYAEKIIEELGISAADLFSLI